MRLSKHGMITENARRLFEKIEELLGVELFVRKTIKATNAIKENNFIVINKNSLQTLRFYIKGEGKYIIRPDRRLTDEEIEKIKKFLIDEGFIEVPSEENKKIQAIIENSGYGEKPKRRYRKFGINKRERVEAVKLILDELIKERGELIQDLISEVKRRFEDLFNVEDYPYLEILTAVRNISGFEITKVNRRLFRVRKLESISYDNLEENELIIWMNNFVKLLKNSRFKDIIGLISYIKGLDEVDKNLIKKFLLLIVNEI